MFNVRLNWKIVVGIIIILIDLGELKDYLQSRAARDGGILDYLGIAIGFLLVLSVAVYFIYRGRKDLGY